MSLHLTLFTNNIFTRYEPRKSGGFLFFCFFSYFDALLLMFEERSIYILGHVTTFLGLSFQIWKIIVYLLKSCLNLKPSTFYGQESYIDLRRKKNFFWSKNNKCYRSLVSYSSLNVLGTAGFCLKFFVLANHNLNGNTESFPMNDYKGKLA